MPWSRLDLVLLPAGPDDEVDASAAWSRLVEHDIFASDGTPSARAASLVEGGFARAWLEEDARGLFYGNQVGGFRVACPRCRAPLAAAFSRALEGWRSGEPRVVRCSACGERSDLAEARFAPPAGFGRVALRLSDVGRAVLTAEGTRLIGPEFERVIARRVNG